MSIQDVLQLGNPLLRRRSEELDSRREDLPGMIRDLEDTLRAEQARTGMGRAIAGIQIGLPKRIILMETPSRRLVMINPVIRERSAEVLPVWDSCFSAGVAFFGETLRHRSIAVAYEDEEGRETFETFREDLAELFQHEIDHLEGVLFTDRIRGNRIIMRREWEALTRRGSSI